MRPTLHAPALIGLVALPLVLSASQVEGRLATSDAATAAATRDVATSGRTDLSYPTTTPPALLPSEYEVPARTGLGDSSAGEIPWVALQAYKRAADILGEVDPSCGISWAMLAAVGQVESEHGRAGGADLGDDGVVHPAIVTRGADAAVGPMQLLPEAWKMAGVDGDGDGTRSPQDLDDAAVAAGVYLCATGTDLRTPVGAQKALLAYNSSQTYVDQVLALTTRYGQGDYAVAEPPVPQTIGVMLDYGLGTPAEKETGRDERRRPAAHAKDPAEEREYTARLATEPGSEPARTADGDEPVGLLAAAPSEAPSEAPSLAPSQEPSETTMAGPTTEPTVNPTPESTETPSETPSGTPSGTPSEAPSESPSAVPSETPSDDPTAEMTGVWTPCDGSYCLDELPLDLTEAGEPTEVAAEDLDGDGAVEVLAQELEGLVGREVVLTVEQGSEPPVVVAVRAEQD